VRGLLIIKRQMPTPRTARTAPAAATDTARRSVLKRIAKALDVDVTELLK